MEEELDAIVGQLDRSRNYDAPPLHLWHPALSGSIPIRIDAQGNWYHDGDKIERESLVRMFASILRREEDGQYYLVTPAEKWRIEVELHPLMVTDVEYQGKDGESLLQATLNTGKKVLIDNECALFLDPKVDNVAALRLPHGLSALFTRAAWYRLVAMAQETEQGTVIMSGGSIFQLAAG